MEETKKDSLGEETQAPRTKSKVVVLAFLIVGLVIVLGILTYAFLSTNGGFFGLGSSKEDTQEVFTGPAPTKPAPTSIVETSPTPRPKGPGTYACSPSGVCNEYDDPKKEGYGCPVTFADRFCLDSCSDLAKRCAK